MAEIRDMMGAFELYQPMELDGALELLRSHGPDAWILSGGLDTFDWLKDRAKSPGVVVDVGGIEELAGIEASGDGVRIGAMTSLDAVVKHPEVRTRYPMLAEASERVATPQIRHQGTLGGNVSQDTRCWYYRSGWPCYRAGGNTCYANAPDALNREHSIFESNRCVAVSPTDTGPALVALDAEMEVRSAGGTRMVPAENFFIGPSTDITRMTVMEPTDLLVAVHIPGRWSGSRMYFEKVADRGFVGLRAGQCGRGAGCAGRDDLRGADGGGRGGCEAAPASPRRECDRGPSGQRGDARGGGAPGGRERASAPVQRIQDRAHPQSGDASDPGGGGLIWTSYA